MYDAQSHPVIVLSKDAERKALKGILGKDKVQVYTGKALHSLSKDKRQKLYSVEWYGRNCLRRYEKTDVGANVNVFPDLKKNRFTLLSSFYSQPVNLQSAKTGFTAYLVYPQKSIRFQPLA